MNLKLLGAIYMGAHGVDPADNSAATTARLNAVTPLEFHGICFLAMLGIQRGGKRPDGSAYPDKNVIDKVLQVGDQGYYKLDQPAPMPIAPAAPPMPQ